MFNVKHWMEGVLDWLGESLTPAGRRQLDQYGEWLVGEALVAGGVGPRERARIESRHLADALSFGKIVPSRATDVLDLGTGVGLPGIPLAILRPHTGFVLLDRSGRRCDLVARAVRILALDNVKVVCEDAATHRGRYEAVTMRAALRIDAAWPFLIRLLARPGTAAIGWRRGKIAPGAAERRRVVLQAQQHGFLGDFVAVPVLDAPAVLLKIAST